MNDNFSSEVLSTIRSFEEEITENLRLPFLVALDLERAIVEIKEFPLVIDYKTAIVETPEKIKVLGEPVEKIIQRTKEKLEELKDEKKRQENIKEAASILFEKMEAAGFCEFVKELKEESGVEHGGD